MEKKKFLEEKEQEYLLPTIKIRRGEVQKARIYHQTDLSWLTGLRI